MIQNKEKKKVWDRRRFHLLVAYFVSVKIQRILAEWDQAKSVILVQLGPETSGCHCFAGCSGKLFNSSGCKGQWMSHSWISSADEASIVCKDGRNKSKGKN